MDLFGLEHGGAGGGNQAGASAVASTKRVGRCVFSPVLGNSAIRVYCFLSLHVSLLPLRFRVWRLFESARRNDAALGTKLAVQGLRHLLV